MSDNVIKIGELLVRAGIVTGVDLSEAEKLAKHMNLQFGQVLIMSGCLSEHDLDCSLVAQELIREELLTVEVACQALAVASQHQMPFEDALEALHVVPKYGTAAVELAELLADAAIIPGELLEDALMTSLTANVSLGELLVNQNAISSSLIPVLNMMLADVGSGAVASSDAINEIRRSHFTWRNSQDSMRAFPPNPAAAKPTEILPAAAPVFVSQELMHAYEHYEPQHTEPVPQYLSAQAMPQPDLVTHEVQTYSEPNKTHSINDVLSKFAQKNPHPEGGVPPAPHDQQVASWNAFVQSQSFDPNDVEALVPPLSVAAEARLHGLDDIKNQIEVVQGTFSKTFDGKVTETLEDSFEPFVPPDFEPAPGVLEDQVQNYNETAQVEIDQFESHSEAAQQAEDLDVEPEHADEYFSQFVELLIESNFFDREDIIVAITNALKEESKAAKLIEVLGLADGTALIAASICSKAVDKAELTPAEAVQVLSDIKGGAEIHEALEAVNLELAVTVSADLQAMFDDEIDETFYVGDVSRNIEIFDGDDFTYGPEIVSKKRMAAARDLVASPDAGGAVSESGADGVVAESGAEGVVAKSGAEGIVAESGAEGIVAESGVEDAAVHVVPVQEETPAVAFGYGRERLKIAKRRDPEVADITPDFSAPTAPPAVNQQPEQPRIVEPKELLTTPSREVAVPVATSEAKRERVSTRDVLAKAKKAQEAVAEARKAQEAKRNQEAISVTATSEHPLEMASEISAVDNASVQDLKPSVSPTNIESQTAENDTKTIRKRNSTTFNSLQALYVAPSDSAPVDEPTIPVTEALHVEPSVGNASFETFEHAPQEELPQEDLPQEELPQVNSSADESSVASAETNKKAKSGSKAKVRGGAKAATGKKSKRRK